MLFNKYDQWWFNPILCICYSCSKYAMQSSDAQLNYCEMIKESYSTMNQVNLPGYNTACQLGFRSGSRV